MAVETYNMTFTKEMADRPLIYNLSKGYELVCTLKRAQLSETAGWVQLSLTGDADEIQRAVADMMAQGVMVTPLHLKSLTDDINPMP
jgi:L-aspartate semialdehyde sulfurtransferase ferredoxin